MLVLLAQASSQGRLVEFLLLYVVIGLGCGIALCVRRGTRAASLLDALWLLLFWPLYGPILMTSTAPTAPAAKPSEGPANAFIAALRRAEGTPLAFLLPEEQEIFRLSSRLSVASQKIQEIDTLLSSASLSEEVASARLEELRQKKATERAISAAGMRLQNIQQLRSLKQRFTQELDEVEELLAQLTSQAEVARLAGAANEGATELVKELLDRVEAFGQALEEQGKLQAPT